MDLGQTLISVEADEESRIVRQEGITSFDAGHEHEIVGLLMQGEILSGWTNIIDGHIHVFSIRVTDEPIPEPIPLKRTQMIRLSESRNVSDNELHSHTGVFATL